MGLTGATTLLVSIVAVVIVLLLMRSLARPAWDRVFAWINRILDIPVGIPLPQKESRSDLYYRPYPRRLQMNWAALILGPAWYLLAGLAVPALWVHATIMLSLVFLSGGLLIPVVWLYCGLKANEDLLEFRIARHNVY